MHVFILSLSHLELGFVPTIPPTTPELLFFFFLICSGVTVTVVRVATADESVVAVVHQVAAHVAQSAAGARQAREARDCQQQRAATHAVHQCRLPVTARPHAAAQRRKTQQGESVCLFGGETMIKVLGPCVFEKSAYPLLPHPYPPGTVSDVGV